MIDTHCHLDQENYEDLNVIINEMKETKQIKGRTIQIADKGLNCGQNIFECHLNKDGYIYSNSVKKLSAKELVWVDKDDDYIKDNEENCTFKYKECIDDFKYDFKKTE